MSLASPRWNKVLRDLWLHKSRTALVGIAISIGIIGAGSVLNTWALLQGATRAEFRASEPASATIRTSGIDEALLEQVRSLPSIKLAEARSVVAASVNTATGWRTAQLMTAPDLAAVKSERSSPRRVSGRRATGLLLSRARRSNSRALQSATG